ncbi:uncharacterized protein, partial [Diabrotica undecimpunctata]|uniref:uncharacterized protein n=1 Tax=Diabrotica undecimpunctata TaxID=50387 RepID=UPI003B637D8F
TPNWVLHITSISILMAWIELMLLIGRLPSLGYYALMFSAVLQNVVKVINGWNFKKADWTTFTERLDKYLGWITPTRENYMRFVGAVISTAKKTIPRGYRKEYVPGCNEKCEKLYQEYNESQDREIVDELLHSLDAARRQKWMETVEKLDFSKSSRKAWSLLRKLGSSRHTTRDKIPIVPNRVASHIAATSRAPRDRDHTTKIKQELKILKSECPLTSQYSEAFTLKKINSEISEVKSGKAPGFDKIHPGFLLHCGKYARKWLVDFYTDMIKSGEIPHSLKRASIIAILKPGKVSSVIPVYFCDYS